MSEFIERDLRQYLGRRVQHDPRSLDFPAPTDTPVHSVAWTHYGPVLNQWVGSCTGHAAAQTMNTAPHHALRSPYLTDDDAMRFYSAATRNDIWPGQYPPEDTGSSGVAVAKALRDEGRIAGWQNAFGLDHMLRAMQSGPVMVGTNWYDGMFDPNDKGFVEPTGRIAGGHEWEVLRISMRYRYFTALNSWGPGWGRKGLFRLSFATMERLLHEDGDVILLQRV